MKKPGQDVKAAAKSGRVTCEISGVDRFVAAMYINIKAYLHTSYISAQNFNEISDFIKGF